MPVCSEGRRLAYRGCSYARQEVTVTILWAILLFCVSRMLFQEAEQQLRGRWTSTPAVQQPADAGKSGALILCLQMSFFPPHSQSSVCQRMMPFIPWKMFLAIKLVETSLE